MYIYMYNAYMYISNVYTYLVDIHINYSCSMSLACH